MPSSVNHGAQRHSSPMRRSLEVSLPGMVDQSLEEMTRGDLSDCLRRVAVEFVPDKEQIVTQINQMRESAPLMSLMSVTLVDREGPQGTSRMNSSSDTARPRILV